MLFFVHSNYYSYSMFWFYWLQFCESEVIFSDLIRLCCLFRIQILIQLWIFQALNYIPHVHRRQTKKILSENNEFSYETSRIGCSDFNFFSESYQVSPIPAFLRTLVFRKYKKEDCHFFHLGRIFFYFFNNLYFFRNFQNQFSKSVSNQSLWNFQGIIFD